MLSITGAPAFSVHRCHRKASNEVDGAPASMPVLDYDEAELPDLVEATLGFTEKSIGLN